MKIRVTILMIFIISLIGAGSFFSLLFYFDPYSYMTLALILLSVSFIFMASSFCTLILYFIKKIYYRGAVGLFHIYESIRQSIFFTLIVIGTIVFQSYNIPVLLPVLLLTGIMIFLELFIQSLR